VRAAASASGQSMVSLWSVVSQSSASGQPLAREWSLSVYLSDCIHFSHVIDVTFDLLSLREQVHELNSVAIYTYSPLNDVSLQTIC